MKHIQPSQVTVLVSADGATLAFPFLNSPEFHERGIHVYGNAGNFQEGCLDLDEVRLMKTCSEVISGRKSNTLATISDRALYFAVEQLVQKEGYSFGNKFDVSVLVPSANPVLAYRQMLNHIRDLDSQCIFSINGQDITEKVSEFRDVVETPKTKGDLAAKKYPNETYDFAIPQAIIDRMTERGFDDAASHFVYLYPKDDDRIPHLAPVTDKGVYILSVMAAS